MYEIHLYAPKTEKLTPLMVEWLYEYGRDEKQPERFWPVRKINPKKLARMILELDSSLIPVQGVGEDVELHFPDEKIGIVLYIHERGVIIFFPYMSYSIYSRSVLGICYTYISYLYEKVGFWIYDPQLEVISYGDDFQSIEETAVLMDRLLPRMLEKGG